ncbi:hypothetical protein BaRGS_00002217 [Batillaria attramentaria]|uniref:N-acetyltransferase 9-like protein n=1 Tax=Batillaria attramentaria TaxID=370345 RepID=A0ABD0M633_9CAEN
MKINQHTEITGEKVILVPYNSYHVPKYHEWMKSEELQKLTASEPLSLEEEYKMQKSWREDSDKCTFIVLQRSKLDVQSGGEIMSREQRETGAMVGDVNLFFTDEDRHSAETEIMIAEQSARGKGCGKEALCSIMRYGVEVLSVTKFIAKIGLDNLPSIRLFFQLGFRETSRSEVFKESTMELLVTDAAMDVIKGCTPAFQMRTTDVIK